METIRCLLSDTQFLLYTAEQNTYVQGVTVGTDGTSSANELAARSSSQLQRALQRLGTFELLQRIGDEEHPGEEEYEFSRSKDSSSPLTRESRSKTAAAETPYDRDKGVKDLLPDNDDNDCKTTTYHSYLH